MEKEHFFQCPYCSEEISMLLDVSVVDQSYVEDCEICCKPIEISYKVRKAEIFFLKAQTLE